ncbi:hypothetical protein SAMN03159444_00074 [Pseudomonas sp. NFACC02]|uniref:hypothetical protein n=1 Tax=Pseudomonas sp. NFACC02 TaxID=1566250 RepID=UPI0008C79333|nr:hypothetical protein [Pseudomonas sp. NFACC02]SEP56895.1 hypothetical protein SAMN03159444_00074 [Pseudomonas sp. NFACC02]
MHFLITPRRRLGVALTKQEISSAPFIKGDVHIGEDRNSVLGRATMVASVFSTAPGCPDALPPLFDANITSMATLGLNISGIEEVEGVFYFQSWWCRIE